MNIECHVLEFIRAPENAVAAAAKAWWQANGFTLRPEGSATHFFAVCGSLLGVTDRQTRRIMEVILKPVSEGTAVSVYHHTGRLFFMVGVMFTDVLQSETDSFIRHIQESTAQRL
jgi:hypothetical protein